MLETVNQFIDGLHASLDAKTFVKLTLGNYRGANEHLQKLLVRLVSTKKGTRLFFLYRSETRDTAKNYDLVEGVRMISAAFAEGFGSGHLFTTDYDLQLEIGKKGKSRLNRGRPTFKTPPPLAHDREKTPRIEPDSFYLRFLGITDDNGRVRDRERDKWRQINKFIEVLASLVDKSPLRDRKELNIVDMGSGKGYLTFAAYDYFANKRGVIVKMTGVDTKRELVDLGSGVANAAGFGALKFALGTIADYDVGDVDILIALHACDTATDDAIFKGISAKADLIIAAPCCHQELRPQIVPPPMLRDILKHGVMLERTAETLTDGLRSLLLERSGYSTKLFEFVAAEHTPKNNMLVGTRASRHNDPEAFDKQIQSVTEFYGITHQRLQTLLNSVNRSPSISV